MAISNFLRIFDMSGPQFSSSCFSFFMLFSPPISFLFTLLFNAVYSLITHLLSENCLHVSSFFCRSIHTLIICVYQRLLIEILFKLHSS